MVDVFRTCVTPALIAFPPAGKQVVLPNANAQAAELYDQLLRTHHMHRPGCWTGG